MKSCYGKQYFQASWNVKLLIIFGNMVIRFERLEEGYMNSTYILVH